jgi:hypothetical protein
MQTPIIVGIALATAHLALIAYVVWLIHYANETDWPMYWLLPLYVDFPASLIWFGIDHLTYKFWLPKPGTERPHALDVHNFIIPFVCLGVGGTAWWFYLPQGIMWVWYRIAG